MAVFLRSLTLLSLTGASATLFLVELFGSWLGPFVSANTMSLHNRQRMLGAMVAGAAVGAVAAVVAWDRNRGGTRRAAHLLAPGMLLGFVPPFFEKAAWTSPLESAIVVAAFVLLAERLYRVALAAAAEGRQARAAVPARRLLPAAVRRHWPPVLVGTGALGYAIYMSVFTLYMHGRFQTFNFDLGQYDNIFWSTLHGYPMRDEPLMFTHNWEQLRGHAELTMFFLLPFYALKPGASTLLVIQSCVLGLGAIPLYRFAARRLPRAQAAVLALAYLFYPPMHGLQFYDFHFQPIASTFVLLVIDLVDDRRYRLCAVAFVLALGCREDISVGLAILGTFLALSGHRVRPGLVMAASASAYFVVMRFLVMPSFGSWDFQDAYKGLFPEGAPNFGGVIATMISNPIFTFSSLLQADKLLYALQILVPVAFLPVRRPYLVAALVPGAIFTLLTTGYAPTIDIGFQYSGHFIPYVFAASAVALAAFRSGADGLLRQRAALAALVTATVACGIFWGAIPPRKAVKGGFNTMPMRAPTPAERQRDRDLKELHAMIPADATVAMSEAEMPHVSRLHMRGLRDTIDADYILYALGTGYGGSNNADRALASGQFEKLAERPGLALLRRKATTAAPAAGR